jgi:hypothetical protein
MVGRTSGHSGVKELEDFLSLVGAHMMLDRKDGGIFRATIEGEERSVPEHCE